MRTRILKRHISFLDELDSAIEQALEYFGDAEPHDIEELRRMRREVADARGSVCRAIEDQKGADEKTEPGAAVAAGA